MRDVRVEWQRWPTSFVFLAVAWSPVAGHKDIRYGSVWVWPIVIRFKF